VADVVVVGAGPAGMAAAARIAKLGHEVIVVERDDRAGGSLKQLRRDGYAWHSGPSSTTLPAVWRDLFRKSGRPLERYVDLRLRDIARRHVFADGSQLDLPSGTRGAQIAAVEACLGAQAGRRWADFTDSQAEVWQLLRKEVLDPPDGVERLAADRRLARRLGASTTLDRLLARSLRDDRLRAVTVHNAVLHGADPGQLPAYAAVDAYVERTFGVWEAAGGIAELADALALRLQERGVELRLRCRVTSIARDPAGTVTGVELDTGETVHSSIVVIATGLYDEPDLGRASAADRPRAAARGAAPASITHLGLDEAGSFSTLPSEVVLHGDPMLVVMTRGRAPSGGAAWTVVSPGSAATDVVEELATRGLDVRRRVTTRIDRRPSPATTARPRPIAPAPGLFRAGPAAPIGSTLPYSVWGAANVATLVGKRTAG
jgi:UDP-galactopyranose mutase